MSATALIVLVLLVLLGVALGLMAALAVHQERNHRRRTTELALGPTILALLRELEGQ